VELFKFEALLGAKPGPAQAYHVQPTNAVITTSHRVGSEIFADGRPALHHGQGADSRELMNQAVTGNDRAVVNLDVSSQEGAIGYNHSIANVAVVPDVSVCHKQIVGPNSGFLPD